MEKVTNVALQRGGLARVAGLPPRADHLRRGLGDDDRRKQANENYHKVRSLKM